MTHTTVTLPPGSFRGRRAIEQSARAREQADIRRQMEPRPRDPLDIVETIDRESSINTVNMAAGILYMTRMKVHGDGVFDVALKKFVMENFASNNRHIGVAIYKIDFTGAGKFDLTMVKDASGRQDGGNIGIYELDFDKPVVLKRHDRYVIGCVDYVGGLQWLGRNSTDLGRLASLGYNRPLVSGGSPLPFPKKIKDSDVTAQFLVPWCLGASQEHFVKVGSDPATFLY